LLSFARCMSRCERTRLRALSNSHRWLIAAAVVVAGCGSTSTTQSVTGPSAPKCTVSLADPQASIAATGGAGAVAVTTQPECAWTALADASWITELTPAQGQGNGDVQFRVASNPNGTARQSSVTVNGQKAAIRQDAAVCQFDVSVNSASYSATGGVGTATITGPGGCAWTASSSVSWITLSAAAGTGSGIVGFNVANNGGPARNGTLDIAGVTITIAEASGAAVPCNISLQPTSVAMPTAGGAGSVSVTVSAGCPWTASSQAPWITLTGPTTGNGNGSVGYTVAANAATSARVGTVNISGQTFTVNQAGTVQTCSYSINPTSQSVPASGATGINVAVSTASGCAWTAVSNAPTWLTITAGGSGSGNGTVGLNAAVNGGNARSGTATIAGQTFTVNQAAAATCTYSINPTSQTVGSDAGSGGPVSVTAPGGCPWTSTANASWLQITSGSSGTGNGTVTFSFADFTGPSRTGTLTIAGQTFTVTQVRCSATLSPTSQSVPSSGGAFSVSLTTQTGCRWTASSNVVWTTITNGTSGTGSKTVNYLVLLNLGGGRSGRLTFVLTNGDDERLNVNQEKN